MNIDKKKFKRQDTSNTDIEASFKSLEQKYKKTYHICVKETILVFLQIFNK